MKLALKTRNDYAKEYLYEVHQAGCAHLRFNKMSVWESDKYNTPEEMIIADIGDIAQVGGVNIYNDYKIMPCVNKI